MVCLDQSRAEQAAVLSQRLGLPLVGRGDGLADEFVLEVTPQRLQLGRSGSRDEPLAVDFSRRRLAQRARGEPLVRAVEGRRSHPRSILDATAGLGTDAFVLAQAGHTVTLVERHPDVAALLDDGLERAGHDPLTHAIAQRMRVVCAEASAALDDCSALAAPEVVYLDPLFPPSGKHALPKKAMQWLRILGEQNGDEAALFAQARRVAREKVVVKRPVRGPFIADQAPDYTIKGRLVRFDVYSHASDR